MVRRTNRKLMKYKMRMVCVRDAFMDVDIGVPY